MIYSPVPKFVATGSMLFTAWYVSMSGSHIIILNHVESILACPFTLHYSIAVCDN